MVTELPVVQFGLLLPILIILVITETNRTPSTWSSHFVLKKKKHSYDYRPKETPLRPVTITNTRPNTDVSLYLNVFRLSFRLFSRYCFLEEYEFATKISGPDSWKAD